LFEALCHPNVSSPKGCPWAKPGTLKVGRIDLEPNNHSGGKRLSREVLKVVEHLEEEASKYLL
jgi:hypothetical protein